MKDDFYPVGRIEVFYFLAMRRTSHSPCYGVMAAAHWLFFPLLGDFSSGCSYFPSSFVSVEGWVASEG